MTNRRAIRPYSFVLRPMTPRDVEAVAMLHLETFPGFFLSFLGLPFLRLFYYHLAATPGAVSLLAIDEAGGCLLGFVGGVMNPTGFYRRMVCRHWWEFCMAAVGAVKRRPAVALRLVRTAFRLAGAPEPSDGALLMSIGVSPSRQGMGIGRALARAFLDAMASAGARRVKLVTDKDGNETANMFYERCGFHLGRSFVTPEGRAMNEYEVTLK